MITASATPCQSVRNLRLDLDMSWSPLCLRLASVFALAANDPAVYVITIMEIAAKRKCRLALDSIGPRYAAARSSPPRYFVVMVDVMEPTTLVAISNCAARSLMLWRFAIQPKSVHTAQTSPLSSCVRSRRTGQSRPAFGLEVMNWVPSGGLPNTSSVEGRSLMPASAASLDWSISMKNWMPFAAMSALIRLIASVIGTALLTRTMPSSLSAGAAEVGERKSKASSSVTQKLAERLAKWAVIGNLLSIGACLCMPFCGQDEGP